MHPSGAIPAYFSEELNHRRNRKQKVPRVNDIGWFFQVINKGVTFITLKVFILKNILKYSC